MTENPAVGALDLLAASIRADSTDLRTYLDVVGNKLAEALPGSVVVDREGGIFTRDRRVRRVTLRLDARAYRLEWTGAGLVASLDDQAVTLDRWAETLARHLSEHARVESQARSAMDGLLAGRLPTQLLTRPAADSIVARHSEDRFSLESEIEVGAGDSAVLLVGAEVVGPLGPGRHRLAGVLPAGSLPADPALDPTMAEVTGALYFVSTLERPNQRFGGPVDKVLDPQTGLAIGLRVFGEYVMRVADPAVLVRRLGAAQTELTDELLTDTLRDVVLKVLRAGLAAHITAQAWPVLGLAAHSDELEAEALERLREPTAAFGLEVTRFGNFTVSMKEEDEALLTQHHARLAEAAASPGGPRLACPSCGAQNTSGARFCSSCGAALAPRCAGCGAENGPGSRFCSQCGRSLAPGSSP